MFVPRAVLLISRVMMRTLEESIKPVTVLRRPTPTWIHAVRAAAALRTSTTTIQRRTQAAGDDHVQDRPQDPRLQKEDQRCGGTLRVKEFVNSLSSSSALHRVLSLSVHRNHTATQHTWWHKSSLLSSWNPSTCSSLASRKLQVPTTNRELEFISPPPP